METTMNTLADIGQIILYAWAVVTFIGALSLARFLWKNGWGP